MHSGRSTHVNDSLTGRTSQYVTRIRTKHARARMRPKARRPAVRAMKNLSIENRRRKLQDLPLTTIAQTIVAVVRVEREYVNTPHRKSPVTGTACISLG